MSPRSFPQPAPAGKAAPQAFRGYQLDPFQREAIGHIDRERSVLVSAPTGTGKTLIADYVIERNWRRGARVVYTAPIKALSNQKYKEFRNALGEGAVGILTGDVVIEPDAPVLVMTTEVFRNLLHEEPERVRDVAYVIFDEIHYLDDVDRGSVWEESLIFMPPTMNFLGLSATIPNVGELAAWISSVQQRPVYVVEHAERAVPLEHHLFEASRGVCTYEQLVRAVRRAEIRRVTGRPVQFRRTSHLDLIDALGPSYFPCLFFTFSRRQCEVNAAELAARADYLTRGEKQAVRRAIAAALERYGEQESRKFHRLVQLLDRGVGFHHAGLLPVVKEVVEDLFERRLIKVLYCTETFAVGLNFPCRTVCFDSYTKWDGRSFRPLTNREYFQMAGRAGRRGIDERGYVFTLVDLNFFDPATFPRFREDQMEPLTSRFSLSYNSVLNLTRALDEAQIADVLAKSFATYQNARERREIEHQVVQLEKLLAERPACRATGTERCPLSWQRLERRLAARRAEWDRLPAGAEQSRRGQKLARSIADLERHLSRIEREHCTEEEVERCRKAGREQKPIMRRIAQLREQLAALDPADRYLSEFLKKRELLTAIDYLRDGQLTARGEFAARIHVQELLVTELFFAGLFHRLDPDQVNALAVCIDYEPRKGEGRHRHNVFDVAEVEGYVDWIEKVERKYLGAPTVRFFDHVALLAYEWSRGASFGALVTRAGVDEGDLVFAFRRGIDILRQVRYACGEDPFLQAKLKTCMDRMDRDEVSVVL